MLRPVVVRTWDQLSVDGDQSTNDTVLLVASGASGAAPLARRAPKQRRCSPWPSRQWPARWRASRPPTARAPRSLITCQVSGAADDIDARAVARAVVGSNLVKAAVHGADPNWGRIAGAAGNARTSRPLRCWRLPASTPPRLAARSGRRVELDPARLRIDIEGVPVFAGEPVAYVADEISARMRGGEVHIRVDLGLGHRAAARRSAAT